MSFIAGVLRKTTSAAVAASELILGTGQPSIAGKEVYTHVRKESDYDARCGYGAVLARSSPLSEAPR